MGAKDTRGSLILPGARSGLARLLGRKTVASTQFTDGIGTRAVSAMDSLAVGNNLHQIGAGKEFNVTWVTLPVASIGGDVARIRLSQFVCLSVIDIFGIDRMLDGCIQLTEG